MATGTADYRAAGYLRAQCFYHYPPDRSEFAQRAHLRMKGDDMWQQLEQVAFKQEDDGSLVLPMIATVGADDSSDLGFGDASICIPTEVRARATDLCTMLSSKISKNFIAWCRLNALGWWQLLI